MVSLGHRWRLARHAPGVRAQHRLRLQTATAGWAFGVVGVLTTMSQAAPNLIRNPHLEEGDAGAPPEWTLNGAAQWERDRQQDRTVHGVRQTGAAQVVLSQPVRVTPHTDYHFSASVRSDGRVIARVGWMSAVYTGAGDWQRLVDLYRTGAETEVTVELRFDATEKERPVLWVQAVSLTKAEPPQIKPRDVRSSTLLVAGGRARAYIVYPSGSADCQQLAERVQGAVRDRTGVDLPLVSDTEATQTDLPVIREQYRNASLILLGRLGTNRALWSAYTRFLAAADGWYPGGDGYVVRTACNVLHNGRHHIVLGGSSDRGVTRAVSRFVQVVGELEPSPAPEDGADGRSREIPWLLDVELGGDCLTAFRAEQQLWRDPDDPLLPARGAGYGNVIRWYRNAMGYYWSGWPDYWQRARECVAVVLEDDAVCSHYTLEFMVRVYDMVDDTPLIPAETRLGLDRLIVKSFRRHRVGDSHALTVFAPPYDNIRIANRHMIAPTMADWVTARFIRDCLPMDPLLRAQVETRLRAKECFLDSVVRGRWGPSQPGVGWGGHEEEVLHSFFRYTLDKEDYAFFTSGNAHRAMDALLAKLAKRVGTIVRPGDAYDHAPLFGLMAHFYRDPTYAACRELPAIIHATGPFMNRYLNGVRRFTPGPELARAPLAVRGGLTCTELMPHSHLNYRHLRDARFRPTGLERGQVLDMATFRSGLGPKDDHVVFSGVREAGLPPHLLLAFASRGVTWLSQSASDGYYQENAVSVERLDRFDNELAGTEKPYASLTRLDQQADFTDAGYVAATLDPAAGTSWQRAIVWVRPGLYVIRDTVTARAAGEYAITVGWRPPMVAEQADGYWRLQAAGAECRITPLLLEGWDARLEERVARGAMCRPDQPSRCLRTSTTARLQAGQSVSTVTVLQAEQRPAPLYRARLLNAADVLLASGQDPGDRIRVVWGPVRDLQVDSDAVALIIEPNRTRVIHGRRLVVAGRQLLRGPEPTNVTVEVPAPALQGGSPATEPSAVPRMPARAPAAAVDVSGRWNTTWTYGGLQRPARIRGFFTVAPEVLDLGVEYELAEISNRTIDAEQKGTLPVTIRVAGDLAGGPPPGNSPAWRTLEQPRVWRSAVWTANYGRGDPMSEGFQALVLERGVRARYVHCSNAAALTYFHHGEMCSRESLRVEAVDFGGQGEHDLLVKSDIWPSYRWLREEDGILAVLSADGQERFQYEVPYNLQFAQAAEWEQPGRKHLVVGTADAMIRLFEPSGQVVKEINLYELHKDFDRRYGTPGARTPAGLYPMPSSLGLWRRTTGKPAKMVVARYVSYSFVDGEGNLEGVLVGGGYWNPVMLPRGVDFDGDGTEETLSIGAGALFHLGGELKEVRTSAHDFPQVYFPWTLQGLRGGDARRGLAGAPVLYFDVLPWGGGTPRYVLFISEKSLAIYDGRERRWAFSWVPVVPLTGGAPIAAGADHLQVLLASEDGLLRHVRWQGEIEAPAGVSVLRPGDVMERITPFTGTPGQALLAGQTGLYLFRGPKRLERLRDGPFVDACRVPGTGAVIAVTSAGEVARLDSD